MTHIEWAIFTSSDRGAAGRGVVAHSPGIYEEDLQELTVWGPSHDSMLDPGPEAESINFHPLPSGSWCISRSRPVGEQSHAGGQRIVTHCLVVSTTVLARFGNNPFAIIQAAMGEGLCRDETKVPGTFSRLEPLVFGASGAPAVDEALVASLATDPGAENMAYLLQELRDAVCAALSGATQPAHLIAGLFNCLPPECRLEFTFSTGLKFSPRRPFRIVALSGDPAERRWIETYPNVTVLDLNEENATKSLPLDGWSLFIRHALSNDQIPFMAAQIAKRRFSLQPDDLPALGLQLLENAENSELDILDDDMPVASDGEQVFAPDAAARPPHGGRNEDASLATLASIRPATHIDPNSPDVLERLEHLDDLVYEAVGGQTGALDQLREAWPLLAQELGEEALDESREQYLRYAMSIWEQFTQAEGVRQPARAIRALDVLCILFDAQ